MQQYHDFLRHILTVGHRKGDRTGTGTISTFGYQMRFDLKDGFPLLGTKRVPFRSLVAELVWFLTGNTSNHVLNELGSTIWDEWSLRPCDIELSRKDRLDFFEKNARFRDQLSNFVEDQLCLKPQMTREQAEDLWLSNNYRHRFKTANSVGDLGPIYQAAWRRLSHETDDVVFVKIPTSPRPGPVVYPNAIESAVRMETKYSGDLDVQHYNKGQSFRIIEEIKGGKNTRYLIQFDKTGYSAVVTRPSIRTQQIKDPYHPAIEGVACFGRVTTRQHRACVDLWRNMISRCYNKRSPVFRAYGGRGVYVSPRWLCFENFFHDIKQLVNYEKWSKEPWKYDIDKDYFGTMCYDVSTCLFLKSEHNTGLTTATAMRVVSPTGLERSLFGRKAVCNFAGVSDETLRKHMSGTLSPRLRGWRFEKITAESGYVVRPQIFIDQIANVIESLKSRPFSRRHIVSAWNVRDLPDETLTPHENVLAGKMALAPCHCFFQFYVVELQTGVRQIDCQIYIRSNDAFLGTPFNIASYALLLQLMANECGYEAGTLVYTIGDAHIYTNHLDQVGELLSRTDVPLPKLNLPKHITISNHSVEEIVKCLEGYNPHPAIKAPVAV